jgi:hypothetical protein
VRADNPPTFANTVPTDHIDGSTLRKPRGKVHDKTGSERRRPHHL